MPGDRGGISSGEYILQGSVWRRKMKKIKKAPALWTKETSGSMIYGKQEYDQETREKYRKSDLNEGLPKKEN